MSSHVAFVFSALLFSFAASAADISPQQISKFAQSPQWKSLFYLDNAEKSRADARAFFVSSERSVESELAESLRLLQQEALPLSDKSFACEFPLRTKRIILEFSDRVPALKAIAAELENPERCANLRAWQKRVQSKSATLIFSSYYMGNPSSTFGHTFLRLNRDEVPTGKDLLDQGINFGANAPTENPVFYALGGLFGFFPGSFIALPYYYKVREYNDYEARDLWEYQLNLTPAEVQDLVAALWEQRQNYYDYYFLTENCGYYMLALAEAAAPRFHLTDKLRHWVIPADTLVVGQQAGLFKDVRYRASLKTQLSFRVKDLTADEKKSFHKSHEQIKQIPAIQNIAEGEKAVEQVEFKQLPNPVSQSRVLDALLDQFDIDNKEIFLEDSRKPPSSAAMLKRALLFQRAELPAGKALKIETPVQRDPSSMHGSLRYGVGYRRSEFVNGDQRNGLLLATRMAYHDFLDPQIGAPQGASIEMFNMVGEVIEEKGRWNFEVENFEIFDLYSAPFTNDYSWKPSWNVRLGAQKKSDSYALHELRPLVDVAGGVGPLLFKTSVQTSSSFDHGDIKVFLGPYFLYRYEVNQAWSMLFEAEASPWSFNLNSVKNEWNLYQLRMTQRWNWQKDWGVDLSLEKSDYEAKGSLNYYLFTY